LVEIVTEAGIVDVLIHFCGDFEHDEAGGVVAGSASGTIVRRTDRTGEAKVNRRADEPTEAAIDVAFGRQRDGARRELIVREPPARDLGKGRGKHLQVVLIQSVCMAHKRLKIKGCELIVGKG